MAQRDQKELDPNKVLCRVGREHEALISVDDSLCYCDPEAVGRRAQHWMRILCNEQCGGGDRGKRVRTAMCAGYLVYAFERYGMKYEEVNDVADDAVATIVTKLTPDNRTVRSFRHANARSILCSSDPEVQLVRLAEIRETVNHIRESLNATLREQQAEVKQWLNDALDLVTSMNAFADYPEMRQRQEKTRQRIRAVTRAVNQFLSTRTIPVTEKLEDGFLPSPDKLVAAAC